MSNNTGHSHRVTDGIHVSVAAQYVEEQSDPEQGIFFFVYRILLNNQGERWAQLESRRWMITDSYGNQEVIEGPGVVGEFPDLSPGGRYSYISFCPLNTEWGTMEGSYVFRREDGTRFEVEIGQFFLAKNTAPISEMVTE